MEEKINIAKILNDKQKDIRLYSPIFGECTFCCIREDTNDICVKKHNGVKEFFDSKGLYYNTGEVMLFPSKEMRDWNKFSWKNGDVLVNEDGDAYVIFKGFYDDTYKTFNGNYYLENNVGIVSFVEHEGNFLTSEFDKANKETSQEYIRKIEERLGGKLNRETLEIEKAQPEFKIGDILFVKSNNRNIIFILSNINGKFYNHRVRLDSNKVIINYSDSHFQNEGIEFIRFATEEEKQQLFDALEKEGKAWDAEKKQIVDLESKVELKPFDKVVVRCNKADKWSIDFFSYKVFNGYICTGDAWFGYCLPYNEETAKLVGTTNNIEG